MQDAPFYPITQPLQPLYHASYVHNAVYVPAIQQFDPTNVWLSSPGANRPSGPSWAARGLRGLPTFVVRPGRPARLPAETVWAYIRLPDMVVRSRHFLP